MQGLPGHSILTLHLLFLIRRWAFSGHFFEQTGKTGRTFKTNTQTGFKNGLPFRQISFSLIDPHPGQVIPGGQSIDRLEDPYEMKFGKMRLLRDQIKIDRIPKMAVDVQLGLYDAFIEVYFLVLFQS